MQDLRVFTNEQFGKVRTVMINGEPWFVLVDVCKALEIGNTSDVAARLEDDEKADFDIIDVSSNGVTQSRNMKVISEPGLYRVIMISRKPDARAFKRWVTHDVLPTIRKNGVYMTNATDTEMINAVSKNLGIVLRVMDKQHSPASDMAKQVELMLHQYGIPIIPNFVRENPCEQLTFTLSVATS